MARKLNPSATVAAMMVDAHRAFEARMACLPEALDFVAAFCEQGGVGPQEALRLALIVEELFTNTVVHGHGGDCAARIGLALRVDPARVELLYEDAARSFDPRTALAGERTELEADLADRPVGRLGIALVVEMASSFSHAYEDGKNRLRLSVARS